MTADDVSNDRLDPRTPAGALFYAEHYWKFGNEPHTQAALHVLREQVRQRDEKIERVRAVVATADGLARMVAKVDPANSDAVRAVAADIRAALDGES